MMGFSAMERNGYDPESGILSFAMSGQLASSPPKMWTFHQVYLHVDDHLSRALSDSQNEMLVSNAESGLDHVFLYYQGRNSQQTIAAQTAAPKGFHLAVASVAMPDAVDSFFSMGGAICLHNNAASEGVFIQRHYTHHEAQQYNNTLLSQITLSFTNEFGQLLIAPPTCEYSVTLEITTAH